MSAVVEPKCGRASHLMEINSIEGCPQVHVHFLTEDLECSYIGFRKVELCCHGCGESVLVYYDDNPSGSDLRHTDLRDSFIVKHKNCPDRNYEEECPNFRTKFDLVDLREVHPRRGFRGTRTSGRREGSVPAAGSSVVGTGRRSIRKEAPKG